MVLSLPGIESGEVTCYLGAEIRSLRSPAHARKASAKTVSPVSVDCGLTDVTAGCISSEKSF